MILRYKNKKYNSDDVPIFLYFKNDKNKRTFINELAEYKKPNEFIILSSVDVVLVGNNIIKDKRSKLYLCLDDLEEKRTIQTYIFNTPEYSNAIVSSPSDIKKEILEQWIMNNSEHFE